MAAVTNFGSTRNPDLSALIRASIAVAELSKICVELDKPFSHMHGYFYPASVIGCHGTCRDGVRELLFRLHRACDAGDRRACIQFGMIVGENRDHELKGA
jgi:hypothetical protein